MHLYEIAVTLKQLGRYAKLNHNIYNAADSTPVDVAHCTSALTIFTQRIMTTYLL